MTEHPNFHIIESFYKALAQKDAEAMVRYYADDVRFSDPVFPHLVGDDAKSMWRMLCARSPDLQVTFGNVSAGERNGCARWVATYTFTKTGRRVVNCVNAEFTFRDGKIVEHRDQFNFWRWSRQALGLAGWLLGWSSLLHKRVRSEAEKARTNFLRR